MPETALRIVILGIIIAFVVGFVGSVAFGWTLSTSPYLATLTTIFSIISYILPIGKLSPILFILISSMVFRIVVSIIKAIWQLIPIRG